ncbi:MAG: VacB/RNase II family 3'-5' exoribonuclease [Marinagarivorans sp.]|nr:VacB/RNase II family 3'-5' exoribonuclease [Marinagarivorans sp.]
MFDISTLAQLSELKTAIIASKEYGQGTVVGSNGRFGFVKLDDGRDAFLNPDKMQSVLPGDKVKVLLTKNDKDQLEATIEALQEHAFKRFVGVYKIKGSNHFVLPNIKNFNRWIFLPPQFRSKCQDGDNILCELLRHPYEEEGKAAAKVVANIGKDSAPYFEHKLVIAKFGLYRYWPKEASEQAAECKKLALKLDKRTDYTHIPFVTIDSYSTRDMDDAVYAVANDEGFDVYVAIADPSSFISPSSAIAKGARDYAQSVYLSGEVLPMLPDNLATEAFSLIENEDRPALICRAQVSHSGEIVRFNFEKGTIRSRCKCNYTAVSDFITSGTAFTGNAEIISAINSLAELAKIRLTYREANNLVHEDQPDYDLQLNNKGKIESIIKRERNVAHKLIEEAMLIINLCAGELLASHQAGIHTRHDGLRQDRLGEIKALLKEELETTEFEQLSANLDTAEGFKTLMKSLRAHPKSYLISPLKRMCATSELSDQALPHSNQGYAHYATVSSPLRRYADLSNHWTISQLLTGKKAQSASDKAIARLNESIENGRQAVREVEQWLKSQYVQQHIGEKAQGHIRIVTQTGFGVKLDDSGIEGFVQIPKNASKSFDAKRMTITLGNVVYSLDTPIEVIIAEGIPDKRRVRFEVEAINTFIAQDAATSKENKKVESIETVNDEISSNDE